jgi:hypothetical protein
VLIFLFTVGFFDVASLPTGRVLSVLPAADTKKTPSKKRKQSIDTAPAYSKQTLANLRVCDLNLNELIQLAQTCAGAESTCFVRPAVSLAAR